MRDQERVSLLYMGIGHDTSPASIELQYRTPLYTSPACQTGVGNTLTRMHNTQERGGKEKEGQKKTPTYRRVTSVSRSGVTVQLFLRPRFMRARSVGFWRGRLDVDQ